MTTNHMTVMRTKTTNTIGPETRPPLSMHNDPPSLIELWPTDVNGPNDPANLINMQVSML